MAKVVPLERTPVVDRTTQGGVPTLLASSLARYVMRRYEEAAEHKRTSGVEERLQKAVRARQGRYMPEEEAELRRQGAPLIYMMLTAAKCRTAAGFLRDVYSQKGSQRFWTLRPTAEPTLPPEVARQVAAEAAQEALEIETASGRPVDEGLLEDLTGRRLDRLAATALAEARERVRRMERRMADQLEEGRFYEALDAFVEDLVTYPAAFLKGPVVRRRTRLVWQDGQLVPTRQLVLEWERVSPFDIFPAPWATDIDDGYLIERRRFTPEQLQGLIGVAGFDSEALQAVLDAHHGSSGLFATAAQQSEREVAEIEGRDADETDRSTITVYNYWGSVRGELLREWGMSPRQVPDASRYYDVEIWVARHHVLKVVFNPDPLGRKPYYKMSYEQVPGSFWGRGVPELMQDCQQACNAAARSLVMNMALASGPQVMVDVTALPDNEDVTQIYPWKIWMYKSDGLAASSRQPVGFFQPDANVVPLLQVYEKFSALADEYTGLPRYMAGDPRVGNIGRTASGMSMLLGQATRTLQQVVQAVDNHVIQPLLERLYTYNVQLLNDPAMTGDVRVVAQGARAMAVRETAQVRRNEFLQLVLSSPPLMQLVGEEGLAALLRQMAEGLDIDVDKLVPPEPVLRARALAAQQALLAQAQGQGALQPQGVRVGSGQRLESGEPVVDNFQPGERG